MISSEANEIAERDAKKTIAAEHVVKALKDLGFEEYVEQIQEVAREHKDHQKVPCSTAFTSAEGSGIMLTRKDSVAREETDEARAVGAVAGGVVETTGGTVWECSGEIQSARLSHGIDRKAQDWWYLRMNDECLVHSQRWCIFYINNRVMALCSHSVHVN